MSAWYNFALHAPGLQSTTGWEGPGLLQGWIATIVIFSSLMTLSLSPHQGGEFWWENIHATLDQDATSANKRISELKFSLINVTSVEWREGDPAKNNFDIVNSVGVPAF